MHRIFMILFSLVLLASCAVDQHPNPALSPGEQALAGSASMPHQQSVMTVYNRAAFSKI